MTKEETKLKIKELRRQEIEENPMNWRTRKQLQNYLFPRNNKEWWGWADEFSQNTKITDWCLIQEHLRMIARLLRKLESLPDELLSRGMQNDIIKERERYHTLREMWEDTADVRSGICSPRGPHVTKTVRINS